LADASGGEPVLFRSKLTAAERRLVRTAPAFAGLRRDWIAGMMRGRLSWGAADLDGDGRAEIIAVLEGALWCGSAGCLTRVATFRAGGLRPVADIDAEPGALFVLPESDGGWRRLSYGRWIFVWTGCGYATGEDIDEARKDGEMPCDQAAP
jgi:hypothetical protein